MITKILAPVDGSPACNKALAMVRELAEKHSARVTLLHVLPLPMLQLLAYRAPMGGVDILPEQVEERLRSDSDYILSEARKLAGEANVAGTEAVLGHPAETIVETAEKGDYSLIVMGSRGLGRISGFMMGSVSSYVATHGKTPVLIVKAD